jgi:plastocyanin
MHPTAVRHPSRTDPLAYAVLVALAAIAALLLTRLTGPSPVAATTGLPLSPQAQSVSALHPTGAAGSRAASTSGTAGKPGTSSTAAAPAAKKVSVMIKNYAFSPATLTVNPGDTVTWTNMDSAPHTVTSSAGPEKLDSPQLKTGDTWSYTFTKSGTESYYCAVHPDMKAGITITGSSAGGGMGGGGTPPSSCDPALLSSIADPFWVHVKHGHLEESPGQQASDLLNVDQYVKTHTVLVESMTSTAVEDASAHGLDAAGVFWVHVKHGHLDESPGQQANDILSTDQYVKTHTVLAENMLTPYMAMTAGSC